MTWAITARMAVDPARDSRPYLLAANCYRDYVVRTGDLPSSTEEAVDRVIDLVRGFIAVTTD